MAVSDDDIIRKRLLIEGDGGSDDRRISTLLKTFIKWCNSNESPQEIGSTYQRMLSTLAQSQLAVEKSLLVYNMNIEEQQNYQHLNKEIEQCITDAYEKIGECKNELHKAKRIRRNRQEYDALAKVIQKHPDRQETLKQLEALDKELESLKDTKQTLYQKLEMRRKQFHVLVSAIHQMQRILEEDEQAEMDKAEMETS